MQTQLSVKRTEPGKTEEEWWYCLSSHLSASQCLPPPPVWPGAGRPGRWNLPAGASPSQTRTALLRWPGWQESGLMPGMGSWKREWKNWLWVFYAVLLVNPTSSKYMRYEGATAIKPQSYRPPTWPCKSVKVLFFGCSKMQNHLQSTYYVITL